MSGGISSIGQTSVAIARMKSVSDSETLSTLLAVILSHCKVAHWVFLSSDLTRHYHLGYRNDYNGYLYLLDILKDGLLLILTLHLPGGR